MADNEETRTMSRSEIALTVGELIALLRQEDPNRKVLAEGCDCINPVVAVNGSEFSDALLLLEVNA